MNDAITAAKTHLAHQVAHWTVAASRLRNLDDFAAPAAWSGLERYLGLSIRGHLSGVVERLMQHANVLNTALDEASSVAELEAVRRRLLRLRQQYLRSETTLDFYADAINTRTNPTIAGLLRALDTLAHRSMAQLLDQLGKPTPVVLTYIDRGLGASILKAGLRLWDGTSESPAAAIKIVRHNLHRATALVHESGHQIAHILGWNGELASALESGLNDVPGGVAQAWASWASEVAADAFAFVNTGYASVAALHDVIAGDEASVLRHIPGDPHPISYIRLLLGVEMCRQFYGTGPWDELAFAWIKQYRIENAEAETASLLRESLPLLPKIVDITLQRPARAFAARSLSALIDPARVSPHELEDLERKLGPALYTSMHWIWTESLRLLALAGLRAATTPGEAEQMFKRNEDWMLRLGGALQAA
jgi:hypothetical protein